MKEESKIWLSLEKYKKVFALKRKARRLQKSWSVNKQEDQKQQNKNKNKKQLTFIRFHASNANHVEGESIVQISRTS